MSAHVTRYSVMPIPPIEANTTFFAAGVVRFGVEFRELTDAVAASAVLESASGTERGQTTELDDRGVSIHVFGDQDGEEREFLRFDCFLEDPHYHYISWREHSNEMLHMDPALSGDPVEFALECLGRRLPSLLSRAGAPELAKEVDPSSVERALQEVRNAAMRLRNSGAADGDGDGDDRGASSQGATK